MKPKTLAAIILGALDKFLSGSPMQFNVTVDGERVTTHLLSGGFHTDIRATWDPGDGYTVEMETSAGIHPPNRGDVLSARSFVIGIIECANVDQGPRVGVAAVLLNDMSSLDAGILMGRRTSPYGRGTWGIPGGVPKPGESFAEAVSREFLEETGAGCIVGKKLGIWQSYHPDFGTVFYRVRVDHRDREKITRLLAGDIPEDSHDRWEMKSVADVLGGKIELFQPATSLRDLLTTIV